MIFKATTLLSLLAATLAAPATLLPRQTVPDSAFNFIAKYIDASICEKDMNALYGKFWIGRAPYPYCSIRMNPRDCLRPNVTGIRIEKYIEFSANLSAIAVEKVYIHPQTLALSFSRGGVEGADPGLPLPEGAITRGFTLGLRNDGYYELGHIDAGSGFFACPAERDGEFQIFVDYKYGLTQKDSCHYFIPAGKPTDAKAIIYA
ncbi:hypothetical protein EYR41_000484 [Orbilia oligospora]|uniref:Uncharacterized protein n=1 Tax=Orbilia oligospora TaxID=2813651 RepID=A0A7C8P3Y8_ORBOL|nr:hypothetical protein TWF751_008967 [Orbilia oligospora]TGJ73384.1 hypothetical protein EYR41_000484 [Orbilia oligospora]